MIDISDAEAVTAEGLGAFGFYPEDCKTDYAVTLQPANDDTGEEGMQVVISLSDHSAWLETYNKHGHTCCLVALSSCPTMGDVRNLLAAVKLQ